MYVYICLNYKYLSHIRQEGKESTEKVFSCKSSYSRVGLFWSGERDKWMKKSR